MYISNVQWRGGGHSRWPALRCLGRLRLLLWLPALHDSLQQWLCRTFDSLELNTLRGLESVAWQICCRLPCQMGCHCLIFILIFFLWFHTYIFEQSCNTRIPVHKSCGPAVADPCRDSIGLMLQVSGRFRPGCDVLRHAHWDTEANDGTMWTALVTWYCWRHFMLVVVSALAAN